MFTTVASRIAAAAFSRREAKRRSESRQINAIHVEQIPVPVGFVCVSEKDEENLRLRPAISWAMVLPVANQKNLPSNAKSKA